MVIHHLYKKSSLFLLMYFQVEKYKKPLLLKNTVIINCIYIRITVLKKHCNSARVICSPKLYGKYKNTRVTVLKKHCNHKMYLYKSHLLNKTLLITNWYQSTQNCKIIEPLAHHLFQTNIKNYRATCSTKNYPTWSSIICTKRVHCSY